VNLARSIRKWRIGAEKDTMRTMRTDEFREFARCESSIRPQGERGFEEDTSSDELRPDFIPLLVTAHVS